MKAFFLLFLVLLVPARAYGRDPGIRVGILGIFEPREVSLSGNLRIDVSAEDGRSRKLPARRIRVRCGGESPVEVQVGPSRLPGGAVEAEATSGLVEIRVPGGPARGYQGRIEIREKDGGCLIVNHLSLDAYARDVACREMRGTASGRQEALRAQVVLSRTYALRRRGRHSSQGYDLCDLTHCQVFSGPGACSQEQKKALEKVSGLALLYRGKPADVYYFSTCGGHTASAADVWGPSTDRSYLRGVPDGRPPHCARSDHMRWRFTVSRSRLCRKLFRQRPRLGSEACQVEIVSTGKGGWVKKVAIRAQNTVEMSGDNFHLLMGRIFGWARFKSARFSLQSSADQFVFRGRGMGHGVGMCQHGAMGMERAGSGFEEILEHYFPGTAVGPWPVR